MRNNGILKASLLNSNLWAEFIEGGLSLSTLITKGKVLLFANPIISVPPLPITASLFFHYIKKIAFPLGYFHHDHVKNHLEFFAPFTIYNYFNTMIIEYTKSKGKATYGL